MRDELAFWRGLLWALLLVLPLWTTALYLVVVGR